MRCESSEVTLNPKVVSIDATPDGTARVERVGEPSSLDHFLAPMQALLADDEVTEICINRPGEAFVERQSGWSRIQLPYLSYEWCFALAKLVANATRQRVSPAEPLLSATLPSGARIQFVLPPATDEGTVSITIRRPSSSLWTLEELAERGVFDDVRVAPIASPAPGDESELAALLAAGNLIGFLRRGVQLRKNILLSGATGTGKTTISKALILEIPPEDRVVTIEDVKELSLDRQPNHVRLYYSQGQQGLATVTAGQLLASAKRQRPDRIFVSELRTGEEVYHYLVSLNSGHPGSIANAHADSAAMAFVALAQLMKRSDAGQGMTTREGVELAQLSIDIVVQCSRVQQRRFVSEVWYDPSTKRRGFV